MVGLLYFVVIVVSNTIGAISGMGGGVIIKPIFDFLGFHSVAAVSFYSAVAVFTMSIVTTFRQIKSGMDIKWVTTMWISFGAIVGGILGNQVFELLLATIKNDKFVMAIQISITVITLVLAFIYTKFGYKNFIFRSTFSFISCGIVLGFLASLLGIGGGPINVSLLMFLFGFPIKEATVYSISTIMFSQMAKLLSISIETGFDRYDLLILAFIIPAAVIGGGLGSTISKKISNGAVENIFLLVIVMVLLINLFNLLQIFI